MKWLSSKILIKQGQGVILGLCHEYIQQRTLQHNKPRERERGRKRGRKTRENSPTHWPTKELVGISSAYHPHMGILSIAEGVPLNNFFHGKNIVSSGLLHYDISAYENTLFLGTGVVYISCLFSFMYLLYQQTFIGYLCGYYLLELSITIYFFPSKDWKGKIRISLAITS